MGVLSQPIFQITLPIVLAIAVAAWLNNKRVDEVSRRIDDVVKRMDRFESLLDEIRKTLIGIEHRLTVLEERGSPLARH